MNKQKLRLQVATSVMQGILSNEDIIQAIVRTSKEYINDEKSLSNDVAESLADFAIKIGDTLINKLMLLEDN